MSFYLFYYFFLIKKSMPLISIAGLFVWAMPCTGFSRVDIMSGQFDPRPKTAPGEGEEPFWRLKKKWSKENKKRNLFFFFFYLHYLCRKSWKRSTLLHCIFFFSMGTVASIGSSASRVSWFWFFVLLSQQIVNSAFHDSHKLNNVQNREHICI